MAKLLSILIVAGALSEALAPSQPPLLIDPAPTATAPAASAPATLST
jgi:hypothetical protein